MKRKMQKFYVFLILLIVPTVANGQLSVEGKEFLKNLFYGLDVNISPIETMNIISKQKGNFYNISSAGILGTNMLDVRPKSNSYFGRSQCEHYRSEYAISLLQWYDSETGKSKMKRISTWCRSYSDFYSFRNLLKSISAVYSEEEDELDKGEKEAYIAYFWDNEETAYAGASPFFVIRIIKNVASEMNCYGCDYNYELWLTFQETNLSK